MKTAPEIRDQLVTLIRTIQTSAGYLNNFDSTKVYKKWDSALAASEVDTDFPKTFVMLEQGSQQAGMGGEYTENLGITIIHVVKAIASNDDSQAMVESALKDFSRFFSLQRTLGGFVQSADLVEFATDGGILSPEGTLALRVKTERSNYGNP